MHSRIDRIAQHIWSLLVSLYSILVSRIYLNSLIIRITLHTSWRLLISIRSWVNKLALHSWRSLLIHLILRILLVSLHSYSKLLKSLHSSINRIFNRDSLLIILNTWISNIISICLNFLSNLNL